MAPAPEARRRGGFSVSNPGAKEYLIVAGVALAGFLAWRWWKRRNTSSASTATDGASTPVSADGAPYTPTGLSTADLMAFFHDFQSSSTSATTGGAATGTTTAPRTVTLAKPRKLESIADQYKISLDDLRNLNPGLNKAYGNFRQIPAGTKVVVSG